MTNMNWYSILSATKLLGTAAALVGVITIVFVGGVEQKKRRIAEYKKSRRFVDWLKIFSILDQSRKSQARCPKSVVIGNSPRNALSLWTKISPNLVSKPVQE
jgi:hypothetical protein